MNEYDKSFAKSAMLWVAFIALVLMLNSLLAEADVVYAEDNTTGEYYLMEVGCEIFDPYTGQELDDNDTNKCIVYYFKNGHAVKPVDPTQNRNYRERMYNDEQSK